MFGGSETEWRGERKSEAVIKNSEAHSISGPQLVRGFAHAGGLGTTSEIQVVGDTWAMRLPSRRWPSHCFWNPGGDT